MIEIIVANGRQKNRVEDYARSIMFELMPRKKKGQIYIEFKNEVVIDDYSYKGIAYGDKNAVDIEIARGSTEDMMVTLAHELVHVKQFFRGEIPSSKKIKTTGSFHMTSDEFEKEAYLYEDYLYMTHWWK